MKVVFDSNVYVSAFGVPGSLSEEAFLLALRENVQLFTSPAILTETANVLGRNFFVSDEDVQVILRQIADVAEIIVPTATLSLLADEPDNRILECAGEARADFIVSGDKHLRGLKVYSGTKIITVAELVDRLGSQF